MIKITGTEKEIREILCNTCTNYDFDRTCDKNCLQCDASYLHAKNIEFEITKSKRWKPEKNEQYWRVRYGYGKEGYTFIWEHWDGYCRDTRNYNKGNVYKTKEEAEEACRVLNIVEENKMTRDEIDDWIYNNQQSNITDVYKLELNAETGIILVVVGDIFVDANVDYFKHEKIARDVLAECGKEALKKYYFKVVG
ncbi:hypothetical protein [uncultured Anaerofustis sp.]|uniref:hypothetical protein n=1 Tax=uncultured Anaerofustis sp. TaxID=904996 RepID=UPI0025DC2B5B|nr:hypothetical protein [uncultured Anaerofustis sp.]